MAELQPTTIETALNKLMERYGDIQFPRAMQERFKQLVTDLRYEGHPMEVIAYCVGQHAAAALATMKMTRMIRPGLADLLAADVLDTVCERAIAGEMQLRTKQ